VRFSPSARYPSFLLNGTKVDLTLDPASFNDIGDICRQDRLKLGLAKALQLCHPRIEQFARKHFAQSQHRLLRRALKQ
jgi:hypothetical protein